MGSSLSGGLVITLASEAIPIACAVAQVPYIGEGGPDFPEGALAAIARAVETGRADSRWCSSLRRATDLRPPVPR